MRNKYKYGTMSYDTIDECNRVTGILAPSQAEVNPRLSFKLDAG